MFSSGSLILKSLKYHWRLNFALCLGVIAGTAVLTGALVVGASMRESLRDLTLQRLGQIDSTLVTDRFFTEELGTRLREGIAAAGEDSPLGEFSDALPAILLTGTIERPAPLGDPEAKDRRAGQVTVVGATADFWTIGEIEPLALQGSEFQPPDESEIVINQPLAEELGVEVGDRVLLRIPQISQVPRESALGKKTDTIESAEFHVSAIISSQGIGRFGLRPTQQTPQNAYVNLTQLQRVLDQYDAADKIGRINALLVTKPEVAEPSGRLAQRELQTLLQPTLDDYGLDLELVPRGYYNLTSERLLLESAVVAAAERAFGSAGQQHVLTYLANSIAAGDGSVPYSTIAALDPAVDPPLGPFRTAAGDPLTALADDEIALTTWAAEDLAAEVGDEVVVRYFRPESTHGKTEEVEARFRLAAVLPLEGAVADRNLTPEFPGITDQLTIGEWDPPFPFERSRIREKDETYWDDYGPTPKAYISLARGQELFGSRWGKVSSIRLTPDVEFARGAPREDAEGPPVVEGTKTRDQVAAQLREFLIPTELGFRFQPIKQQQIAASSGSTPFDALFLGFSMFIIAAALMLVALLFRLNVESRARQVGLLQASGFTNAKVRRLLLAEGLAVTAVGALVGVGLGVLYAWGMLAALTSPALWLAAIRTPFLELHPTPTSLLVGYLSSVIICGAVIWWSVRRLRRLSIRQLMAGQAGRQAAGARRRTPLARAISGLLALGAIALIPLGTTLTAEAQAGAFFGSGALLLMALLVWLWSRLRESGTARGATFTQAALVRLAFRNGARHPGRSTLTIGLVAAAAFLIVAISAFRIDASLIGPDRSTGNGGFTLVGLASQPVYRNLSNYADPEVAFELNLTEEDLATLEGTEIFGFRYQPGDDSSCLNLYQTDSPQVLGAPAQFIARGGFAWAGSLAEEPELTNNPWLLLNTSRPAGPGGQALVPVVIDAATANYSLKVGLGSVLTVPNGAGDLVHLQVVGLLSNSILQGSVLMSEANFLKHFPNQSGTQFYLIDAPQQKAEAVAGVLEQALAEQGFDAVSAQQRLADFLAVQNTYLLTFQSLGGLGLLLGTFGLAVVQLRNVLERRGELALLRAAGFRKRRLAGLVLAENLTLLLGGLGVGVLSAMVAISPHLFGGGATIPFLALAGTLAAVLVAGLIAATFAIVRTLATPLLPALREE